MNSCNMALVFILLAFAFSALHIYTTEADRLNGAGFLITILAIGFSVPAALGKKWANWVLLGLLIAWIIKGAVLVIIYKVGLMVMVENSLTTPIIRVLLIALLAQYALRNVKQGTLMLIVVSCAALFESMWGLGQSALRESEQIKSSLKVGESIVVWKLALLSLWKAISIHFVSLITKLPFILAIVHFVCSMKVKEIPVEKTLITLPRAKIKPFLESVSYLFVSGFGRLEMMEVQEYLKEIKEEGDSQEFTFFPYFEGKFVPLKMVITLSADVAFYAPENLLQRIKQKRLILK